MIQCPSCGKDIADDSAHCGFCGAKVETGAGKKTMIGFAALTGDALKQAAEEARQAREAAEAARSQAPSEEPRLKLPKPGLPKPGAPTPAGGTPGPPPLSKLALPGSATDGADADAKTAVMPAIGEAPSTVTEGAVGDELADTDPMSTTPAQMPHASPAAPVARAEETIPERPVPVVPDGPTEFGGGPIHDGPSEFGTGSMQVAQNTLPEKKKNPALIAGGVIAVLLLMCCLGWIALNVILPAIVSML